MNEKEARELLQLREHRLRLGKVDEEFSQAGYGATCYLECLEKARGLEKALEKISKYECDCFSGCGPCLDITNQVAAEALAKWQEEK